MLTIGSRYSRVPSPRSLYAVPDRRVSRAAYVPLGRTLHLVDLENLMGGPFQPREVLCGACAEYRAMAPVADGDLVVVATNPALLVEAGLAWPGARLLIGSGPDGADLALMRQLGDARWIARRFDRVVIGSGDGIFTSTARAIRQFGIAVGVVGREGGISKSLLHNTDFCRLISDPMEHRVVA